MEKVKIKFTEQKWNLLKNVFSGVREIRVLVNNNSEYGDKICDINWDNKQAHNNAKLIESSPRLYDACTYMIGFIESTCKDEAGKFLHLENIKEMLKNINE